MRLKNAHRALGDSQLTLAVLEKTGFSPFGVDEIHDFSPAKMAQDSTHKKGKYRWISAVCISS